jgi:hypothetical protein
VTIVKNSNCDQGRVLRSSNVYIKNGSVKQCKQAMVAVEKGIKRGKSFQIWIGKRDARRYDPLHRTTSSYCGGLWLLAVFDHLRPFLCGVVMFLMFCINL